MYQVSFQLENLCIKLGTPYLRIQSHYFYTFSRHIVLLVLNVAIEIEINNEVAMVEVVCLAHAQHPA